MAFVRRFQGPVIAGELGGFEDRSVMARALAYLFAAGAGLALISLVVPASFQIRGLGFLGPVTLTCAVASLALVAILFRGSEILRLWTFQCILAAGTVLISAAIYLSGEISTVYVMFYVWVTLYAFYFFSRTQAALQLAFLTLAYSAVLFAQGMETPLLRWIVPVGTLVVAGALIAALRDRIVRLIERLADAARTDVLTGLTNRRGFEERFALELERAQRAGLTLSVVVGDLDRFKDLNDHFGHRAGDRALQAVSEVLSGAKRRIDAVGRIGGEEFALLMPGSDEHQAYLAAERLRGLVREATADLDRAVTISFGIASFPRHGRSADTLMQAADEALYAAKELGRDRTALYSAAISEGLPTGLERRAAQRDPHLTAVAALSEALEARDSRAAEHSKDVAAHAARTAVELGLPASVVNRIQVGGMVHDIGKLGVPDTVLQKTEPLTQGEWREIERHPEIGARILENIHAEDLRSWVLAHHERPDGRGYPEGLEGDAIPLEARILAVAEAYQAMTSEHSYRQKPLDEQKAREELRRGAGSQFDGEVVRAFLRALDGANRVPAPV